MEAKADFKEVIIPERKKIEGIRNIVKCTENPFLKLKDGIIKIDQERRQILAGTTKNILVNSETGATEGITLLARYKEVDTTQFVKLFINQVSLFYDLSKAGIRVFSYVLQCMQINKDEIHINIPKLMESCGYKTKVQAYKGLAELVKSQIIAQTIESNIWYINPHVVFNGDRVMFITEYRKKERSNKQLSLEMPLATEFNTNTNLNKPEKDLFNT